LIEDIDDDGGGGVGSDGDVYKRKVKPMLVLLLDSYSKDNKISVGNSRYSSYPAYTFY